MSTDTSSDRANLPPLALIAGPTASGKSDLAVRLALALKSRGRRAVVINADSAQVYNDLAVLSARPTAEEMQGIEHRLFGTWDGATACSAADWARAAQAEVERVQADGDVPILVGGTGLYLRTLLDGIAPVPPIDPAVREAIRAADVAANHAALLHEDPERAAKLSPNDTTRVARALEVIRSTGRTLSEWQSAREGGIGDAVLLSAAVLLPPRDWLYQRCDQRFSEMLEKGAIAEVEALMDRDLDPDMPVMRAIGVPELKAYLSGEISLAVAENRAQQATRNYAKRQLTWFRNQPPADWRRIAAKDYDLETHFALLLHD